MYNYISGFYFLNLESFDFKCFSNNCYQKFFFVEIIIFFSVDTGIFITLGKKNNVKNNIIRTQYGNNSKV